MTPWTDDATIVWRTAASRQDTHVGSPAMWLLSLLAVMQRLTRSSAILRDRACWINDLALS